MRVPILKQTWMLLFQKIRNRTGNCTLGDCDDPNDYKGKFPVIRIDSSIKGRELLTILIHEVWHASDWYRDEEFVKRASKDMANILWKLGYRRDGES